ncbi:MAG TPA: serine/threonine-protein kinase [Kofleriaceae bacterium]|nr:serine/threonine-protein kinase [Kofleriaceae bacterium]
MADAFGSWDLESLVAVGGLGEVWRARRIGDTGKRAALKRLHTHLGRNAEALATFATEQRLATTLPLHPNVVHASEAGEVAGRPYLAMELVAGEDLRRIVAPAATRDDPKPARAMLPRARAIAIVVAAADGAAHLHAQGFVHGDLNPSNLLVEARPAGDRVVVVDLGVARAIGEAGTVRGTHAYMAPEQVKGGAWTPATDVFALGVVLWELIAAQRLFHRGPPWLSMAAVVEDDVPPLADAALDRIARAALAKEPGARTATAAELAAMLRAL